MPSMMHVWSKSGTCGRCVDAPLRRVNRVGFLQQRILTYVGYYPWECVVCRRIFFRRDRGGSSNN